MALHQIF